MLFVVANIASKASRKSRSLGKIDARAEFWRLGFRSFLSEASAAALNVVAASRSDDPTEKPQQQVVDRCKRCYAL